MSYESEIHHEFVGAHSLNSFVANNSSPRSVMFSSHYSQHVGLTHYEPRIIKTGAEYEMGKYINDVRVDNDSIVRGIVPRYTFISHQASDLQPEYFVLVEYEKETQGVTKLVLDVIEVPNLKSNHTKFGFELFKTNEFKDMVIGSFLRKDTILGKTTSLSEDGSYMYGLNVNSAFMSHPGVSEDGIVVSKSFIERVGIVVSEKRIINLTKSHIPLNLYGNSEVYKLFPDIGEPVRPDGLLFSARIKNDFFNPVDMDDQALRTPNHIFDSHVYVKAGSYVTDVKVLKGNYRKQEYPTKVTAQLDNYCGYLISFYKNLKDQVDSISHSRKTMYSSSSTYELSPRLHRLLVEAEFMINSMDLKSKIKMLYRKLPVEEYRVEITTKCIIKPDLGFKLSDLQGSKGVICKIMEDEDMPIDAYGNRVDIITDASSTVSRMNIGRVYESYLGAYCRDNYNKMLQGLYAKHGGHPAKVLATMIDKHDVVVIFDMLSAMYKLINDDMYNFITGIVSEDKVQHIREVVKKGITLYYPPDNTKNIIDVIKDIEKSPYKPYFTPLTYTNGFGKKVTTTSNIRVGVLYIMVLEKIADSYMAVSSAKLNNFGFPSKVSSNDKHKTPHALTPTKICSEADVRLMNAYMSDQAVAEFIDSIANPYTHKLLVKSILESPTPMTIPNIDRSANPLGNSKGLMIFKHIVNCAGFNFKFVKEKHRHAS